MTKARGPGAGAAALPRQEATAPPPPLPPSAPQHPARPPWVPGRWAAARLWHLAERVLPSWTPLDQRSYSHQGEDRVLLDLLHGHAPPTYADVGAHHPVVGSDTYLLYRTGWSGLAIDGDARWAGPWRRRRPRDRFVAAAIAPEAGRRTFYLQDESSTLLDSWGSEAARRIEVDCTTLDAVLAAHGVAAPLGLLKLDLEGLDLDVLLAFPVGRWAPCAILAETHHWETGDALGDPRLAEWMEANGYSVVAHNRRNVLLARRDWLASRYTGDLADAYRKLNPALYAKGPAPIRPRPNRNSRN